LQFFFSIFFSNSNCTHIRGPYRVLGIKYSLSHTHPNRGVGANNLLSSLFYLFIYWLLVWYESLNGPKRGMTVPIWVTPCIRLNLRPKLKRKRCQATNSYPYWWSNSFFSPYCWHILSCRWPLMRLTLLAQVFSVHKLLKGSKYRTTWTDLCWWTNIFPFLFFFVSIFFFRSSFFFFLTRQEKLQF